MLKASKSSPCLVTGKDEDDDGQAHSMKSYTPPVPEQAYYNYIQQQQQAAQQTASGTATSPYYQGASGGGAGAVAIGDKAGGAASLTGSLSSGLKLLARTSSRRAAYDGAGAGSGKANISGPLQLLPDQDSSDYQQSGKQGYGQGQGYYQNHQSPYGGAAAAGGASMKMILGLRVGNGSNSSSSKG
ncbi:hypothetical protein BGX24_003722 [Mortierella sp. AD032]|nr:hypothetical protein BGX24_003722 [Mortierella sp. AD032]